MTCCPHPYYYQAAPDPVPPVIASTILWQVIELSGHPAYNSRAATRPEWPLESLVAKGRTVPVSCRSLESRVLRLLGSSRYSWSDAQMPDAVVGIAT
jgi:hypothetical protein